MRARRCGGVRLLWCPGTQRRAAIASRVVWVLLGPGVPFVVGSRSPSTVRAKAGAAGQRALGIHPQGLRSAGRGSVTLLAAWGERPGVLSVSLVVVAAPRLPATRAESSDRRVSGPSVERARLRGRGGADSLYRLPFGGSGSSSSRPSLQTHFGWRPAINSELARTRGIRLSN